MLICVGTLSNTYMSALDNVPTPGNSWHGTECKKKKQLKEATLFESFGQNLFFLEMPILAHCA